MASSSDNKITDEENDSFEFKKKNKKNNID